MPPADEPQGEAWDTPGMVRWCRLLLDSYAQWTGRELLDRVGSPEAQARAHAGACGDSGLDQRLPRGPDLGYRPTLPGGGRSCVECGGR